MNSIAANLLHTLTIQFRTLDHHRESSLNGRILPVEQHIEKFDRDFLHL